MKSQRGFTLIEVLVALLVFALIATAASEVSSQYITSYERVQDKTLAAWLAENRINEMRLQNRVPATSESTLDTDFGPYRWQVFTRVSATADERMRKVEVSVGRYRGTTDEPATVHSLAAFVGGN